MANSTSSLALMRTGFERFLAAIVIVLLVGMTAVVFGAVVFRKLGASLVWYDEVASIMLAWLTYYGSALAALKRSHIGFPGLIAAMPPALRLPFVILAEVIVIGFFVLLAWVGIEVLGYLEGLTLVSLPWVPVWFTQSVIPIGAVLFIIAELMNLPEILREARGHGPIHDPEIPPELLKPDLLKDARGAER
ncbi:TRAP transporter small permease [Skermanella pratensis]|uniref:TRAP transporter small permease n=1 Tax=Skermanella pratensis TaxID=2233999 RepID=UPI001B3BB493|nr:TRAP transporter small permease [Skermanella pratensis]